MTIEVRYGEPAATNAEPVRGVLARDRDAWEGLVRSYNKPLYCIARSLVDEATADDAVPVEKVMVRDRDGAAHRGLRTALSQYATGVAVVTTVASDGCPVGMTINSFSSLSATPPLVLWCIRLDSASLGTFTTADHFAVNVLAASQERLARRFAARNPDRFAGLRWHQDSRGMPLLHGGLGSFTCRRAELIRGGDHLIIVGHVEEYEVTARREPLVFYDGRYHTHLSGRGGLKAPEVAGDRFRNQGPHRVRWPQPRPAPYR
jgi:flavin reductase (DIM6/NTAB) family NADH-FMN oxidoreductase RutF